jgi:type I site-specific restriction-modification system R (restriction) subunit
MVLAVNGLPVATAELKNPFIAQSVEDANPHFSPAAGLTG